MTTQTRDMLDLTVKAGPGPYMEANQVAEWIDLHPSFGWNVQGISKSDIVGLGLAIMCAGVIARDIAKTDMNLWKSEGDGWVKVKPSKHPLAKLLARRPNAYHSWTEFWQMTILHLRFAQNAYILKGIRRDGTIEELIPLMPSRVRQRVSISGNIWYEAVANTEFERSMLGQSSIVVPADRMIHLKGRMLDGMAGLSNQVLGDPIFMLMDAITNYQNGVFGNDGKLPLVFETDQQFPAGDVGNTAFRRLKEQLKESVRKGRSSGDPILLEAGLKAKAIALNAKESMPAEAFNQVVASVCRLMEIPPHKIFHYESVKYENMASADNLYANDSLIPTARTIEERLRLALLTDEELDEYDLEFDRLQMTAGDPASMQKWVDVGLKTGALEINEARERFFQMNPIKGGNVRLVPVNMSMVDRDGQVLVQGAAGQVGNDGNSGEATPSGRSLRLVSDQG